MNLSPHAPGSLGAAPTANQMLDYLGQLDTWLAQIIATNRQAELTADMALAMALWQAAKARQNLLLATWDSGRVAAQELARLSALIWGRLDTATTQVASLQSMAVSLPEAGRLCDALVAQLRTRLNTDPNATALQMRLADLRAQAERIRDQLRLEPPALAPSGQAKLAGLSNRITELAEKQSRGGDITGSLSALEIEAAKLERDLIVGAARRREGRDLLTKVREERTELSARQFAVQTLADQARAAVWPPPAGQIPQIESLGPVPNTAAALAGYLNQLAVLDAQLTAAQGQLAQRLVERDAAAAQLAALQTKASAFGHDSSLTELAALISARLAKTPVVLPAVQQLLGALAAEIDFRAQGGQR